jgi:hypothetical protein
VILLRFLWGGVARGCCSGCAGRVHRRRRKVSGSKYRYPSLHGGEYSVVDELADCCYVLALVLVEFGEAVAVPVAAVVPFHEVPVDCGDDGWIFGSDAQDTKKLDDGH